MNGHDLLAGRFEENRSHLRAVAYRMLGSLTEADDAVQEAWLRLSRSDAGSIENLGGWLTTVVARVCLDMLRARASRREESLAASPSEPAAAGAGVLDPEHEALLADSVGLALLVILDRLTPPERLAFVLHDMFAVPFEEIADILGRSPAATRQLASRARRRVQGTPAVPPVSLAAQKEVVEAFLTALRGGDIEALLGVLDPDLVVRADRFVTPAGVPREIHGSANWARQAVLFSQQVRSVQAVQMDGAVGLIWAPRGQLRRALRLTIANGKIAQIDIIGDPSRLRSLDIAPLRK